MQEQRIHECGSEISKLLSLNVEDPKHMDARKMLQLLYCVQILASMNDIGRILGSFDAMQLDSDDTKTSILIHVLSSCSSVICTDNATSANVPISEYVLAVR